MSSPKPAPSRVFGGLTFVSAGQGWWWTPDRKWAVIRMMQGRVDQQWQVHAMNRKREICGMAEYAITFGELQRHCPPLTKQMWSEMIS